MNILIKLIRPIGMLVSEFNDKVDRMRLHNLIRRGLKVGKNVYINKYVKFDYVYPFLIEIGDNCRISTGVNILAHDATTFRDLGITRIAKVRILEGCFIGEGVIILPGVTIGPRALVAAGSVVNRDIGENKTAAGNPARPYGKFSDLLDKYVETAKNGVVFNKKDIEANKIFPIDLEKATEKYGTAFVHGVPVRDPFYVNTDFKEIASLAKQKYNKIFRENN
jgi:maltose O-acetyltransferase